MNKKIASEIAIGIIFLVAILIGGIFYIQNVKNEKATINPVPVNIAQKNEKGNNLKGSDDLVKTIEGSIFYKEMQAKIENWSNYKDFNKKDVQLIGIEECKSKEAEAKYLLFMEKANKDIKKFELSKVGSDSPVSLYIVPNYAEYESYDIEQCNGGLGGIYPVQSYSDYTIWGWLSCSAGFAPESGTPEYDEFANCEKTYSDIKAYFKLKEVISEHNEAFQRYK